MKSISTPPVGEQKPPEKPSAWDGKTERRKSERRTPSGRNPIPVKVENQPKPPEQPPPEKHRPMLVRALLGSGPRPRQSK